MTGAVFELSIKNRQQQILKLPVKETSTIFEVKKKLQDLLDYPVEEQLPLYFNGSELADDNASLLEYSIVEDECPGGPVLTLGSSEKESFDLECQLPNGKSLKEHVSLETTIAQLKGRITSEAGIPYLCMKIFAERTELKDPMTLRQLKQQLPGAASVRVATTRPIYAGPAA
eukprot:TRINITY_DN97621_c0_g1_i1.p1 TRINITY_DN97621_c0_g1~~TRINITY_DN97621_c0_g1_i1.p1  ORF type:complete len:182 (-),score=20.63 TRINITY_DN97621_c0_g1_i1:76-591(-)